VAKVHRGIGDILHHYRQLPNLGDVDYHNFIQVLSKLD
jgi:hypothetical protein